MSEITQETWDSFILENNGSFLQCRSWADFQKSIGKKVLLLKEKNWQASVIVNPLPFGKTYFYAPYGPVWDPKADSEEAILADFIGKIKSLASEHGAIFLKVEPKISDIKTAETLEKMGFKKNAKSVQPSDSSIIDLSKSENEILESFEKRCRYEIKQAVKKNVSIYRDNSGDAAKEFLALLDKTAERDSFRSHPRFYYQKMIQSLAPAGKLDLFFTKLDSEIISACIIIYSGKTASYVHAASAGAFRAANALVWEAMKEAKKKQCLYFDLYGVAPADAPESHPWSGLTKFKKSFGGRRIHYIGAFDYPLSDIWYKAYKIYKNYK